MKKRGPDPELIIQRWRIPMQKKKPLGSIGAGVILSGAHLRSRRAKFAPAIQYPGCS